MKIIRHRAGSYDSIEIDWERSLIYYVKRLILVGSILFPVFFLVSCTRERQEWTGSRDLIAGHIDDLHSPLEEDGNKRLIFGAVPVSKPGGRVDSELAAMAGRWEGYDAKTATKLVFVVLDINNSFGNAYWYAAQNLQYPREVKEINFQVNGTDGMHIEWTGDSFDVSGRANTAGHFSVCRNRENGGLTGSLWFAPDRSDIRYFLLKRDDSYYKYSKLSEYLLSDTKGGLSLGELDDAGFDGTLGFYKKYSGYTDPGEYEYLFNGLPDSLEALTRAVNAQLIHPFDIGGYDEIPQERYGEAYYLPSAADICSLLVKRNSSGFVPAREPSERAVVTCRYHALLLASVLKSKGIPARLRYGFAGYLQESKYVSHVICEVWDFERKRWIFADPDENLVDISGDGFLLPADLWREYREDGRDLSVFGIGQLNGPYAVLDFLYHDFMSVLGMELKFSDYAYFRVNAKLDVKTIPGSQLKVMDEIARLMSVPEEHLAELVSVYNDNPFLRK